MELDVLANYSTLNEDTVSLCISDLGVILHANASGALANIV